jgi:phosphatidylserine/phosphatidylglycerophosphate/cardiolipin synthase-like enzyme
MDHARTSDVRGPADRRGPSPDRRRPDVGDLLQLAVTVYIDATAGTPQQVAEHLRNAAVFQTITPPHRTKPLVSHAKFVVIDHAMVLTTSANFSHNAENSTIELGLLVHDTALAEAIEQTVRAQHGELYERVRRSQC